ncbi:hypothetical protein GJ496_003142 [Pomphorhynchus laevis]|nr:hypothetical protein GJ496_003142 [Pomphorhynchus laevis]
MIYRMQVYLLCVDETTILSVHLDTLENPVDEMTFRQAYNRNVIGLYTKRLRMQNSVCYKRNALNLHHVRQSEAASDLLAFERRLTDIVTYSRRTSFRWKIAFVSLVVGTVITGWFWMIDLKTDHLSIITSLNIHWPFTASTSLLMLSEVEKF